VADPVFDLRRGVDSVNGGGGGRKSLKVLKVEVKVIFSACFSHTSIKIIDVCIVLAILLLKLLIKIIASEERH